MTALKNGGPAFPATTHNDGDRNAIDEFGSLNPPDWRQTYPGMTLRDCFAAKALQGLLASESEESGHYNEGTAADRAYCMADAMIAERAKAAS